jgi:hypothetical protein
MEEWRDIEGYGGLYQVSSLGRVKSLRFGKERVMIGTRTRYGYLRISLCVENKQKTYRVHRLVAKAFIINLENKPEINHINGIKDDNRVENLEWSTRDENMRHAAETGLMASLKGEDNKSSKLNDKQVLEIREKYIPHIYHSTMLAKEYGVDRTLILGIVNRKFWTHI